MTDKLIEVESQVATLQRTVDQLSEVIVEQGKLLDVLQRQVEHLTQQLQAGEETTDERPPHY